MRCVVCYFKEHPCGQEQPEEEEQMGNHDVWMNEKNDQLKQQAKALQTTPPMHKFKSGAKSTVVMPRFDLIPLRADELNAGRFGYGAARHGERNYLNGKGDEEFIKDRINHLHKHLKNFARHRKTSDLAAILCNASILAEVEADTVKDGADGSMSVPTPNVTGAK